MKFVKSDKYLSLLLIEESVLVEPELMHKGIPSLNRS